MCWSILIQCDIFSIGVHWTDGSRMDFSDLGTHTDGLEVESAREAEDLDTLESPIGQCFAVALNIQG